MQRLIIEVGRNTDDGNFTHNSSDQGFTELSLRFLIEDIRTLPLFIGLCEIPTLDDRNTHDRQKIGGYIETIVLKIVSLIRGDELHIDFLQGTNRVSNVYNARNALQLVGQSIFLSLHRMVRQVVSSWSCRNPTS